MAVEGIGIVCVGFNDWDNELWTNQHHLMARLARDNDVLFVESLGLRRPQIAGRDLRRIARRLRRGFAPPRPVDGLHVLSPLVLPLHGRRWQQRLNATLLRRQVRRAARRLGIERPVLWAYVPQAEALTGALKPARVVYHCVDDIASQKGIDGTAFRAAEARFAAGADLVLASAPALAERMRALNPNTHFAPNVADTALFASALEPGEPDAALAALARPRVVFTGAIVATKLDLVLLAELARRHRDWSFALVGPVGLGDPLTDVSALADEPNVHLLGGRRYGELPAVLRAADAAIIPYAVNDLTRSVFPMKVYEYLAAGLPVVATPLPALAGVDGITVADGIDAFDAALARAIGEDSQAARRERSRAALGRSWEARLDEIGTLLST